MTTEIKIPLTRENILSGRIHELIEDNDDNVQIISNEDRRQSLKSMLENKPVSQSVWLFAYGSLIWNPTINYTERRRMIISGYHRKFCLKTYLGRGSKETPGLMLGLDHGGSCKGIGYTISPKNAFQELEVIWRREMVTASYVPKWLSARIGDQKIKALGFVVNRKLDRYVNLLEDSEVAKLIYNAAGFLGTCSEYLEKTAKHLDESGIPDKYLTRIQALVQKLET